MKNFQSVSDHSPPFRALFWGRTTAGAFIAPWSYFADGFLVDIHSRSLLAVEQVISDLSIELHVMQPVGVDIDGVVVDGREPDQVAIVLNIMGDELCYTPGVGLEVGGRVVA